MKTKFDLLKKLTQRKNILSVMPFTRISYLNLFMDILISQMIQGVFLLKWIELFRKLFIFVRFCFVYIVHGCMVIILKKRQVIQIN